MTPLQRVADALLAERGHGGIRPFVEARRAQGRSWRSILRELEEATDGAVDITDVTLRAWMDAREDAA